MLIKFWIDYGQPLVQLIWFLIFDLLGSVSFSTRYSVFINYSYFFDYGVLFFLIPLKARLFQEYISKHQVLTSLICWPYYSWWWIWWINCLWMVSWCWKSYCDHYILSSSKTCFILVMICNGFGVAVWSPDNFLETEFKEESIFRNCHVSYLLTLSFLWKLKFLCFIVFWYVKRRFNKASLSLFQNKAISIFISFSFVVFANQTALGTSSRSHCVLPEIDCFRCTTLCETKVYFP